jgi:hypothetical protein
VRDLPNILEFIDSLTSTASLDERVLHSRRGESSNLRQTVAGLETTRWP